MEHKKRYLFGLLLLSALAVVCAAVTSLPVRSRFTTTANESVSVDGEIVELDSQQDKIVTTDSIGQVPNNDGGNGATTGGSNGSTGTNSGGSNNSGSETDSDSNSDNGSDTETSETPDQEEPTTPGEVTDPEVVVDPNEGTPTEEEPVVVVDPQDQVTPKKKDKKDKVIPGAENAAEHSKADQHRNQNAKDNVDDHSNGAAPKVLGIYDGQSMWKQLVMMAVQSLLNQI